MSQEVAERGEKIIHLNEGVIRDHLGQIVRGTVNKNGVVSFLLAKFLLLFA